MHKWIAIATPDDYAKLENVKELATSAGQIVNRLKQYLSDKVKGVLVEHPYVDKDYRSTYYGFYAKKGQRYDPFCVRLHFFNQHVRLTDDLTLESASGELHHSATTPRSRAGKAQRFVVRAALPTGELASGLQSLRKNLRGRVCVEARAS